jgi:hypothetical protein
VFQFIGATGAAINENTGLIGLGVGLAITFAVLAYAFTKWK